MEDIFKTFKIKFSDRDDFNKALGMNHLACDVGHADMVLVYTNEYFRDRVAGFLATSGIENIEVYT